MSVSGVDGSGGIRSEQARSKLVEQDSRVAEDRRNKVREEEMADQNSKTSEPGRGENMDVVA